ncbi:MAG: bifunctional (p)ppGpp synthetase/guanosine-3',5'-bis(diphosphate) 3'-pyrophosphohydrolase [Ectothiorhodospiraceae bacterium AqS1]|nr:bifunctional (p)ppGpp synthetase/guanosine-3',5'-bis(diphosphate) 3'-pyrophosphohydrolase [Ectothiorhodospiraceae bacterium AqS1]MBF2759556.1 bifunctional (p)ppGpp synthetase/guanosine-3',5'-bis(diphosphate) 3'-pyrophosphohydrolase [Ectothiorhodospiraceae bacterium AqS1]
MNSDQSSGSTLRASASTSGASTVGASTAGRPSRRRPEALASEAIESVGAFIGVHLGDTAEAILAKEREAWPAVSAMIADLNLGLPCIQAALLAPLVHRGIVDREAIGAHFEGKTADLVEGLLRFEALRSLPAGDSAAGDRSRIDLLRKLLLAAVDDVQVVVVHLVLTLHRLRTADTLTEDERLRLAEEGLDIAAPLAGRLGVWQYKWEIEDLSLRESDPQAYRSIAASLNQRRADREADLEVAKKRLQAEIAKEGIEGEISARVKHIHSIWRKMQRKSLDIAQIFDQRALRVLVESVAQCYTVLGIVHNLWTHIPREFDDYITRPKPNGYQSLHTAVLGPGGRTLEVQIRTREMHAQAELGVAAHWRYKEGGKGAADPSQDSRISWLRHLLDPDTPEDEDSLLASLGKELDAERVYAFTPRGDIFDLPMGSTPLDFAYQVHTQVGHRCRGAKVNGRIVPLTHILRSGDQIEILTAPQPRPSRDWLNPNLGYLGNPRSRASVRNWFKQQDRERNIVDGQEIWDREIKRLRIENPPKEKLIERFNLSSFDDVLAAMGRGDISGAQIAGALQPWLQESRLGPPKTPRAPRSARHKKSQGVRIQGVGNLLTQMARCCSPLLNDPIKGFITRGRGVSIHRSDCRNILNLGDKERARLIDVEWSGDEQETWPVDLVIEAHDRKNLLRDITAVVSGEALNIVAMDLKSDPSTNTVIVNLTLDLRSIEQLSLVLDRLSQLPNIFECRRRA